MEKFSFYFLLPQATQARKNAVHKLLADWTHDSVDDRIRIADEHFICTTSAREYQFMHRKKSGFLIDDRPDNCQAWTDAGGIAIQHNNVNQFIDLIDVYV